VEQLVSATIVLRDELAAVHARDEAEAVAPM
jgi:hypothetical protein